MIVLVEAERKYVNRGGSALEADRKELETDTKCKRKGGVG